MVTGTVTGIDHANRGRHGAAGGARRAGGPVRRRGGRARLGRPHAADPRAGRAGHRLQDRRRGHLPAQPRAGPAGRRGLGDRRGAPAQGADLRLRRRRVRRRRGASPRWRTWPATRPGTTPTSSPRTCAGCWWRRPAGSCPRSACRCGPTRCGSCSSATWTSGCDTRLESWWTVTSCSATARSSTPTRSSGPPASRRTRCWPAPTSRATPRAGSCCTTDLRVAGVEGAWSAGDCAAVPDLTAEEPGVLLARPPSTRSARPAAGRQHRRHRCGTGRWSTTSTSTSARWPASACTRASPRCTASRCAGWPAWFMHRTYHLSPDPDASTARSGCWSTGRWRCSSSARWSRSGSCSQPRQEFQQAAQPTAPDGRATDVTAAPTTRPEPTTDGRRAG